MLRYVTNCLKFCFEKIKNNIIVKRYYISRTCLQYVAYWILRKYLCQIHQNCFSYISLNMYVYITKYLLAKKIINGEKTMAPPNIKLTSPFPNPRIIIIWYCVYTLCTCNRCSWLFQCIPAYVCIYKLNGTIFIRKY